MNKAKLLISIGAEGGSIAVYRDASDPPRYKAMVADQTPTLIDADDGGGPATRRDSGWLSPWTDAIAWLGRYPWPNLSARHVDASVADDVRTALKEYIGV